MLDRRETGAGRKFVLERFNVRRRPLRENLNSPVIKVLHITDYLVTRRRALSEETITHTLHVATDEKPARNFIGH